MTLATIVSGVTGWDGRAGLLRAAGRCYRLGRHGDLRLFLLVLLGHGILSFWHVGCAVLPCMWGRLITIDWVHRPTS